MSYSFISKEANEMKRNFEKENRNVDKGIEHAGFMLDRLSQVFNPLIYSLAPIQHVDKSENLKKNIDT